MGNFQGGGNRGGGYKGGRDGGRPNFRKKSWSDRGGDRGDVEMHKAVCDQCSKTCEVPFRPSGDKPIYCTDCFSNKKGSDRGARPNFNDRGPRRDFNDRPALRPEFSHTPVATPAHNDSIKQFAEVNAKLDRLINSIEKLVQAKNQTVAVPTLQKIEANKAVVAPIVKKVVALKAVVKKVIVKKKVVTKKK